MDQIQAFSSGFPIWIIPDLEHSKWAQKLDWYLNFQLRRASLHQPKKISELNLEKIASWGVQLESLIKHTKNQEAPLLIDSRRLLPNEVTVQIPFQDVASWSKHCLKILKELKLESARIFLPLEVTEAQLTKAIGSIKINLQLIEEHQLD